MPDQSPQPPGTDAFPFEWLEPADAELSWEWDDMHMPFALSPLAGDYVKVIGEGFAYRYERLELPMQILCQVWNGYAFFAARVGEPDEKRFTDMNLAARRSVVPITGAYWRERALRELPELYAEVDGVPVETLTDDELAAAWEPAWGRIGRAWRIHFFAITGPYQALNDLADLYEAVVAGASPGQGLRLVQGGIAELQEVESGLERLGQVAEGQPIVHDWLLAAENPTLPELSALPNGPAVVAAISEFLARHGHLGQGFDDLALPSWGEEPSLLLAELAKRLRQPAVDAGDRQARLAAEADALADGVRARLASDPERLTAFEQALAHARDIGPITESHNYWIDRMALATLRRFVRRVGQRLVERGVIEAPDDIFFLGRGEVPELLRVPEDRRVMVRERRDVHAGQLVQEPPRYVGQPPEEGGDTRFDTLRTSSSEDGKLQGVGASAGLARGPARVTLSPADFARVQAGDIIVCPSSNPSWVPLFAIAGGLVTNTGGVLSHAAVVAREFGLPAVVGTGDATTRIADGRMVELDGTSGEVRLL
ncbi:MAG: PEP-utilizing enzyme [Chloroflexota bacterium]|nr:PEP-utilizing enzyme [Chloroflexota bacterium]